MAGIKIKRASGPGHGAVALPQQDSQSDVQEGEGRKCQQEKAEKRKWEWKKHKRLLNYAAEQALPFWSSKQL